MLFHVSYNFAHPDMPTVEFFDALLDAGRWEALFDGCMLIETELSAIGLRKKLRPFFDQLDKLMITEVYAGHSAGCSLSEVAKERIKAHRSADPYPFKPDFKV